MRAMDVWLPGLLSALALPQYGLSTVFVVSFISNVLVAALIVYLGDQLGVGGQLSTGVVVVLGVRIFGNVAAIRRHLFRA